MWTRWTQKKHRNAGEPAAFRPLAQPGDRLMISIFLLAKTEAVFDARLETPIRRAFAADAAYGIAAVAGHAMRGACDADQFLDIQVQQIAWGGVLVTLDHRLGIEIADAVDAESLQNAADRGPAQSSL